MVGLMTETKGQPKDDRVKCATHMKSCYMCGAQIKFIKRVHPDKAVFISPVTLQALESEAEFKKHTQHMYAQLAKRIAKLQQAGP